MRSHMETHGELSRTGGRGCPRQRPRFDIPNWPRGEKDDENRGIVRLLPAGAIRGAGGCPGARYARLSWQADNLMPRCEALAGPRNEDGGYSTRHNDDVLGFITGGKYIVLVQREVLSLAWQRGLSTS